MSKKLYLECSGGISGDMTVAALLDLGASQERLEKALKSLPVHGYEIEISRVKKAGLDACDFHVVLDGEHENYDHDMEYLHGHGGFHEHWEAHVHEHGYEHTHTHTHTYTHTHTHTHEHQSLPQILEILDQSSLTKNAKETARKIFHILADAEAKAHGVPKDQVHFHEVGAVDSIVDIAACAVCLDDLGIGEVIVPVLCEGTGTIRCQHGVIPVPVPAVVHIVEDYGLNLQVTDVQGELVTPTGAAFAAAVKTTDCLPEEFRIVTSGIGAGKRNYKRPSILRAMIIEDTVSQKDVIYKLETNVDDATGENLGYAMERLLDAGAKDVHYFPVFMKKNRPGYQLNVICEQDQVSDLEQIIFEETTTIGIRRIEMERTVLKRRSETIHTSLGDVRVKICDLASGERKYPEYDSIVKICRKTGMSFQEVTRQVMKEWK